MTTVEGMWKFQSGSIGAPSELIWGGIVVLESGRVFGGDSVMAYLGNYVVSGGMISADVRSWSWNDQIQGSNVFGLQTPIDVLVKLEGKIVLNRISGSLFMKDFPQVKLAAGMEKLSDLP